MKAVANKDGDWLSKLTTELCPICCSVSKGGAIVVRKHLPRYRNIKLLLSPGDDRQASEKGEGGGGEK